LQKCWKEKLEWDEKIENKDIDISNLLPDNESELRVPRCIISASDVEYICFCDASENAYACCLYSSVVDDATGRKSFKLLIAKTRLAPMKKPTIPRLELMGALLAAKVVNLVRNELKMNIAIRFFCDSKVVNHWINNPQKSWTPFVQRRVNKIVELSGKSTWSYVPSKCNPADVATRGSSISNLHQMDMWWNGPSMDFVASEEPIVEDPVEEIVNVPVSNVIINKPNVFQLHRYGSWIKAVKIVAYVAKFISLCRKKCQSPELTTDDLKSAERFIVQQHQTEHYADELQSLKKQLPIDKSSSIYQLNPIYDENDGLIKVNTRLQNSNIPHQEIYPIIVPHDKEIDRLLIRHHHIRTLHSGVSLVLSELRKFYWLPKGRQRVKSIINDCSLCKRRRVSAGKERYAPLPMERVDVDHVRPFLHTGVDFFGPIACQSGKVYGLIFTCLQIRAVHIELTNSLEACEFLDAFDRFISRRSCPETMHSDNATTFKAASKVILAKHHIQWKFIVELAPNQGGAWERLVQTVKRPLRLMLRNQVLNYSQLNTWLCKIELVTNLRPLTYLSDSLNDIKPITPNDFLLPMDRNTSCSSSGDLLKILLSKDETLKTYLDRWRKEYIKERIITGVEDNPMRLKEGDVVLLDNGKKKEFWPLARVVSLRTGRDGIARSFLLKCNGKIIRRGLTRVYFLERPVGSVAE